MSVSTFVDTTSSLFINATPFIRVFQVSYVHINTFAIMFSSNLFFWFWIIYRRENQKLFQKNFFKASMA